jgi:hypothetical protein
MIKITQILWSTLLFSLAGWTTVAAANQPSIVGSYKSNGYTLDIGIDGDYHSCDPRNRCLVIPRSQSSQQGKVHIWRRDGVIYRVTPLTQAADGHATKVSVQIIRANSKVIFDRIFRSQ